MGLIRELAGKKYRLTYDEASGFEPRHLEEGKLVPDDMYEVVPCRYGEIYDYGDGRLAWYCPSRRKGINAQRLGWPWLEVQVEADDEWIFLFPAGHFTDVASFAGARTKRQVSEQERERLAEMSKKHSPLRTTKFYFHQ